MKKNILNLIFLTLIVAFVACLPYLAQALPPYKTQLGNNTGFLTGTKSLSISSTAAVQLPTLPDGAHEVWVVSANAFNYGDSTVTTATTELFNATSTVLKLDKFTTKTPTVYFRCRGTDTVATCTLQYR